MTTAGVWFAMVGGRGDGGEGKGRGIGERRPEARSGWEAEKLTVLNERSEGGDNDDDDSGDSCVGRSVGRR